MKNSLYYHQKIEGVVAAIMGITITAGLVGLLLLADSIQKRDYPITPEQKIEETYEPSSLEEGLLRDLRF